MPDSNTLSAAINPSAVDVIIPAHCAASTLADCLDSVLAQTFQDWHAIIILNQSGYDASMGIAGKYSGADPRIRTEYLQRGDLSSAINYGLSIASAPNIAMLDADDMYDPRFLECALTAIRNFGADLAITDVERFGEAPELHGAIETNAHRALEIVSAALKQCAMDVCFRYAQYDEAHRHDFRTVEALRIARVELKAYGRYLPALEHMRLGFILAHPESVEKLVRRR